MRLSIKIWKFVLLVAALWSVHACAQSAAGCGHGFDDNNCIPRISVAAQAQPQCSTAAGWTTITASVWQGSKWSTPNCSYTAQPTCASGYTTLTAATWNGSSWTDPVCQAPVAAVTPATQAFACYTQTGSWAPWASVYPPNPAFTSNVETGLVNNYGWWEDFTTYSAYAWFAYPSLYTWSIGQASSWSFGEAGIEFYNAATYDSNGDQLLLTCGLATGTNTVLGMGFIVVPYVAPDPGNGD